VAKVSIHLHPLDLVKLSVGATGAVAHDSLDSADVVALRICPGIDGIVARRMTAEKVVQIGTCAADGVLAPIDKEAGSCVANVKGGEGSKGQDRELHDD